MSNQFSFVDLQNMKVLIIGEVGSGKTSFLSKLLKEALEKGLKNDITVIDLAPKRIENEGVKIGGKISDFFLLVEKVRYLAPTIETPRLSAGSAQELIHLVNLNKKKIERVLDIYNQKPSMILFVNDVSLYFQAGVYKKFFLAVKKAETVLGMGTQSRILALTVAKKAMKTVAVDITPKLLSAQRKTQG